MAGPLITLTTDFGRVDGFVGAMTGAIATIAPDSTVIDITHDIPPQDIATGAYLFNTTQRYFPAGTIHVIVVDPGVGTHRRPIALQTESATFICPDNGVLSYMFADAGLRVERDPFVMGQVGVPTGWNAFHLKDPSYWLHPLSTTFHGRDLFAPVAGHFAAGVPLAAMGTSVVELTAFALPLPREVPGMAIGQVMHIDRFGNLITNLRQAHLPAGQLTVEVAGHTIHGITAAYQDSVYLLALIGSSGTIEIAYPNANAAKTLGVAKGAEVRVYSAR
jgi:S-adenosylmethionine hydrolase